MIRLFHQDALEFLRSAKGYRTVWMDVPDNNNTNYGPEIDDYKSNYLNWLQSLITLAMRTGACSIWVSYNSKWDVHFKARIAEVLKYRQHWTCRTIIWRYTFGQYLTRDHTYGYRPILRLNIKGLKWNFNGVRIPSERMRLGDPRAAGLKIPDDVWDFPRIVGNNKERKKWAPNQHPVGLVERVFKLSGGPILELFTGSGSAIQAAKNLGVQLDTVELSEERVKNLEKCYGVTREQ